MENLFTLDETINKENREQLINQKGCVIWLSGLSGAGKSTIAILTQKHLHNQGKLVYLLDGDNIRLGINSDLGFTINDRTENIRRVAHIAKLMADAGMIVLVSFITPTKKIREVASDIIGEDFHLVYMKASLKTCKKRDPKGLYKKVDKGEITLFTGITSPYEMPLHPTLILDSEQFSKEECSNQLTSYIMTIQRG